MRTAGPTVALEFSVGTTVAGAVELDGAVRTRVGAGARLRGSALSFVPRGRSRATEGLEDTGEDLGQGVHDFMCGNVQDSIPCGA